ERAADQRAVLVEHAFAAVVEVRARRLGRAVEEPLLLDRRAGAPGGMRARLHDLPRPGHNFLPPRRVQFPESLGDHRYVAGADLGEAVTAETATSAALQVLRLRLHDAAEEGVRVGEDPVVADGHLG